MTHFLRCPLTDKLASACLSCRLPPPSSWPRLRNQSEGQTLLDLWLLLHEQTRIPEMFDAPARPAWEAVIQTPMQNTKSNADVHGNTTTASGGASINERHRRFVPLARQTQAQSEATQYTIYYTIRYYTIIQYTVLYYNTL